MLSRCHHQLSSTEASAAGKRKRPADENADDGFKAPKVQGGGENERERAMRLMMEDDGPVGALASTWFASNLGQYWLQCSTGFPHRALPRPRSLSAYPQRAPLATVFVDLCRFKRPTWTSVHWHGWRWR